MNGLSLHEKHPIFLLTIVVQSSKDIDQWLHIACDADTGPQKVEDEFTPEEKTAAKDWEESFDLGHVDD